MEEQKNIKRTSKYAGVHWDKTKSKWIAQIGIDGKSTHLGCFLSETEASDAYNEILNKLNTKGMEEQKKYKGVSLHKASGKYIARATVKGKTVYMGIFNTAEEASNAVAIKKVTTRLRNVNYCKRDKVYTARITHKGKRVTIGSFKTALQASNAVDNERERLSNSSQDIQN